MANFGSDVTGMSNPDLRGASHVNQGVEDNSLSYLISKGGDLGIELYKQKQYSDLNKKYEGINQDYMDRRDPEALKTQAEALQSSSESLFKQGVPKEEMSPVQQQFENLMERYNRARKQGVMSPDEFSTRTLAALRAATNHNPGLAAELSEQAKRTLELSGITGIVKKDELLIKSQVDLVNKQRADLEQLADKHNVTHTPETPTWKLQETVNKAVDDAAAYTQFLRQKEVAADTTIKNADVWIEAKGDATVRGGLTSFYQTLLDLGKTAEGSPQSFSAIIAEAGQAAQSAKLAFTASIDPKFRALPNVVALVKDYNTGIDNAVNMLSALGSGENMKKALQNQLEVTKTNQDQAIRDKYDVSALDLVNATFRANPNILTDMPQEQIRTTVTTLNDLISGLTTPGVKKQVPKSIKDKSLSRHLEFTGKLGSESGNFTGFNNTATAFIKLATTVEDPNKRLFLNLGNLEAISKQDFSKAKIDTVSIVKQMIYNTLEDPDRGLQSMIPNVMHYKIDMDVTPDGRLIFNGKDANVFNRTYAIQINTALEAYAKVHNIPVREASKTFYPEYFKKYTSPPTDELLSEVKTDE